MFQTNINTNTHSHLILDKLYITKTNYMQIDLNKIILLSKSNNRFCNIAISSYLNWTPKLSQTSITLSSYKKTYTDIKVAILKLRQRCFISRYHIRSINLTISYILGDKAVT